MIKISEIINSQLDIKLEQFMEEEFGIEYQSNVFRHPQKFLLNILKMLFL